MSQIIKTKFYCKNGSQTSPRNFSWSTHNNPGQSVIKWKDRFIEGKWYDGEYETYSWNKGYELNDGWKRYWVINEMGEKEEIPKAHMKVIFELDKQSLRDHKIDEIL